MNQVWPYSYYIAITIVLFSLLLTYLRLARRYSLFDTPNERSSHSNITIRGGGVIFLVAIIIYLALTGGNYLMILTGALLLGFISFVDDIRDLSAKLRLGLHFIIILAVLNELGLLTLSWILPIVLFFFLWLMNAYNFMDGINGITFSNTLSHLLALIYASYLNDDPDLDLLLVLLIANSVFGFFNFRKKAVCFLGDVGSIPLGFMLISFTLMLVVDGGTLDPLVFFAVYMLDSGWTIAQRLLNKENIMKPHRKHLYQLLANEYRWHHLLVSSVFFLIQMSINAGYFLLDGSLGQNRYFFIVMGTGSLFYIALKYSLLRGLIKKR